MILEPRELERRLEDRIRILSDKLAASRDAEEVRHLSENLQKAISEHIKRLRAKLSDYARAMELRRAKSL